MGGYIGSATSVVSSGSEQRFTKTATEGQTTFTGLSYTPNFEHVYQNGVRLVRGTDYTATDGSSVVLNTGAAENDEIVVVAFGSYQVADSYTKAEADSRYPNTTSGTSFPASPNLGDEVWRTDLEAWFKWNNEAWTEI